MARTVKDANLGTRNARDALAIRRKPYYRLIMQGLHLGYYKGSRGGSWTARRFIGDGRYEEAKLGATDDVADADGLAVLSFHQAQEHARDWFSRRAKADAGQESGTSAPYTVSNALDDYLRDYVRRGGRALDRTHDAANPHIRPTLGSIEVAKLSRRKLEAWLEDLANTPPRLRTRKGEPQKYRAHDDSPEGLRRRRATANKVLGILKAALNLAFQHKKVASKDAWEAVKPYRDASAPKIRYLTDAESRRLINACPSPFRELVTAALLTGARYGELCAMAAGDFDPAPGTIHIPRSKSGKARHVHLTDEGRRFFAAIAVGKGNGDLLFTRSAGESWEGGNHFRRLQDACRAARIAPAIGFHILRHTYASRLAMKGAPLHVIAVQLGHTDTRMTERHYAHLAPSYVGDTVRAAFGDLGVVAPGNVVPII